MFLKALEFAAGLIILAFVVTQIVFPLWTNRPLFPLFRPKVNLAERLRRAQQELDDANLQHTILTVRAKAEEVRKGNDATLSREIDELASDPGRRDSETIDSQE